MKRAKVKEPRGEYVSENGDTLKREGGKIWSPIRQKWLVETPEEYVRQEYLLILLQEYGFTLDQISRKRRLPGAGPGMRERTSWCGAPPKTRRPAKHP